jgi:hypothetical protein
MLFEIPCRPLVPLAVAIPTPRGLLQPFQPPHGYNNDPIVELQLGITFKHWVAKRLELLW